MDHNMIESYNSNELTELFFQNKTEMSCMDNPETFLNQLRDHKLITEDQYQKVKTMTDKVKIRQSIYELLDSIQESQHIKQFWTCVFRKSIVSQYPTLEQLRDTLFNGQKFNPDKNPMENSGERPGPSDRDDQQGHSFTQSTPMKKKNLMKPTNASPLLSKMPVTCGALKGILYPTKMAKGMPCIEVGHKWYTPHDFQKLKWKARSSNWKKTIQCKDGPLEVLFENGQLVCPGFNMSKSKSKAKKSMLPCRSETGHDLEGVTDERPSVNQKAFPVKCGELTGTLLSSRFASGTCGKSIRTKDRWLTPEEFVKAGSAGSDTLWKRDIQCRGKPLSDLIKENGLRLHPEHCPCLLLCNPDSQALENQNNDDECCICRGKTKRLVLCDKCPLSFHPKCHLPRVQQSMLKDDKPWMCTFCIWKVNKISFIPMTPEAMLMCPVSNYMLQCHYLLMSLYNADKYHIFAKDPCIQISDYSSEIAEPMWLDKITEQLLDNQYNTVGQLLTDIRLIFSNCNQFNRNNEHFRVMGVKLKELHEGEVENVFQIQQHRDALVDHGHAHTNSVDSSLGTAGSGINHFVEQEY